nr:immunoglobulin heavy chain junction region [Macaca mulatta]MOX67362.1 immunoglobulin heavy chain junction region [Macaca mulatta]MOX68184.1 immunoglobulin heavy chain junction region [Macaca mulatta]MOX68238.1 immunoglobulin heavy chain junction region [Macaca mulatta]
CARDESAINYPFDYW